MEREYTLTVGGRRHVIRSARPLSDAELAQIAQQLRTQPTTRTTQRTPTQAQPRARTQTVAPRDTPAARNLAGLVIRLPQARGLSGEPLLNLLRQYAPAGMSEAEIRAAAIEVEAMRGARGYGSALADAALRPETARPDYDPTTTPPRKVGFLEGLGNLLGTPLRALTTSVLTWFGRGRTFGKETGAPTQVSDYATTYAADPNWGSVLEAFAPNAPAGIRQPLGVLGNIFLDPLNLTAGLGVIGRGATTLKATERATKAAQRTQQALKKTAQTAERAAASRPAVKRVAQPVARAAQKLTQAVQKAEQVARQPIEPLSFLDNPASVNLARWLGVNPLTAQFSSSPLRIFGLPLHLLLDPIATARAIQEARSAERGARLSQVFEDLANVEAMRRRAAHGEDPLQLLREFQQRGRLYAEAVPDARVSADELRQARELIVQYADKLDELADAYLAKYGARIDPDKAKELIPEYGAADRATRAYYSPLVHPISSSIAWRAYEKALQRPDADQVVLVMGAPGAGKSTLIERLTDEGIITPRTLVHDRSFSELRSIQRAIELARHAGKPITIVFVDAPERFVINNVIRRAFETGRTPSLDYVVDALFETRQTARQLYRLYNREQTDNIRLLAYRNTATGTRRIPFRNAFQYATPSAEYVNRVKYIARRDLNDYLASFNRQTVETAPSAERSARTTNTDIYRRLAGLPAARQNLLGGIQPTPAGTGRPLRQNDTARAATGLSGGASPRPATALTAEAERLVKARMAAPSFYERALSLWKATKTTLNPPSFVRNFLQNFVLRFIEGEPIHKVPTAALQLVRDKNRFRELWHATDRAREAVQEAEQQSGLLKRLMEAAARGYEGADRLAAVLLAQATGKRPESFLTNYGEIPRSLEWLRKTGIAPFIAWQYFAVPAVARGALNSPARTRAILQALTGLQPEEQKRGEYLRFGDRELRTGTVLPLNPADFGGEMPFIDLRQVPILQLGTGLQKTLSGEGRPFPMQDASTNSKILDTALFLKDFLAPPALSYYLPGLIAPPEPTNDKRRPRERLDYLLGLLGFSTRPIDELADAKKKLRETKRELRQSSKGGE